jgi:hypothetical protein
MYKGTRDHLFDHLSIGEQAFPCGSTEPPKSGNRLSKGVHRGFRGTNGPYVS